MEKQDITRKTFQRIYPFTTEEISGYFKDLDFNNKKVMTLGSSSDQAFNALLLGAKKIVVYDINENAARFGKLKRDVIINSKLEDVWENILDIDIPMSYDIFPYSLLRNMNIYMHDEESYKKLQELLKTRFNDIEYRIGNIMEVNNLDNELFDIIITSNVFRYLEDYLPPKENPYDKLKEIFTKLKEHLNKDGIIQLLYYYAFDGTSHQDDYAVRDLVKVLNTLYPDLLEVSEFDNGEKDGKDCAIYYRKKR